MSTDNSTPSFDAPPTDFPMSGNPWQQPIAPEPLPQQAPPRKTRGLLFGGAAAATALAVGLGAGYYLGNDDEDSPSEVTTYAGDLGEINSVLGSFGHEATLPTAFASALVQCAEGSIVQGQGNPATDGTSCSMVLNGYRGQMVYTQDAAWIADMKGARADLNDYHTLDIAGFDAFVYIDRMSGKDSPVITLVDSDEEFYLDVSPRGIDDEMDPTPDEIGGFTAAVVEALRV